MRRRRAVALVGVYVNMVFILSAAGCSASSTPAGEASQRAELEKVFQQTMSGATLEGYFTVDGSDSFEPRKESYHIESVSKLAGGYWTFQARIQYGERDITLPIPVQVQWAGDTPVVTLTDAEIPGLGTFTARVLFYRGRYAGTWSHGDRGGNQFGRIVPAGSTSEQ